MKFSRYKSLRQIRIFFVNTSPHKLDILFVLSRLLNSLFLEYKQFLFANLLLSLDLEVAMMSHQYHGLSNITFFLL